MLTASVQILTQDFETTREFVLWGVIDSCSLRALLAYVDISNESYVYVTPATAINAAWDSQWYQRSCTRAEKRAIFGHFPEKSELLEKYILLILEH